MQCYKPINLQGAEYPCGKCAACRISRTREWATRILHEVEYHESSTFITLTYSDNFLPNDNGLHKRDLQLYFKRLRKDLEDVKIKYFACGEYGEERGRPHYHAIIFGLSLKSDLFKFVKTVNGQDYYRMDSWDKGYIYIGSVTYQSARYVAGYIQKKWSGEKAKEVYGGREAPFQIQSQGIGKLYIKDNEERLIKRLKITVNGAEVAIPRYYRKVLGEKIDPQVFEDKRVERANERLQIWDDRKIHPRDYWKYKRELRGQQKADVEAKVESWKKREDF